jgi:hypothetical protein
MENLLEGVTIMTQTTQSRSLAALSDAENELTPNNPETEDNAGLLLTICSSLNELYEKLSRLNYLMGKKIAEYNLHLKGK